MSFQVPPAEIELLDLAGTHVFSDNIVVFIPPPDNSYSLYIRNKAKAIKTINNHRK